MKTLICFAFALLATGPLLGQQSTLKGQIAIQNSQFDKGKVEYLPFVEVDETAQPRRGHALTDAQGQWTMDLVGIADKDPVFLKVIKEGWQVVNGEALQATAGQKAPVRIVMATSRYITEAKRKYYNTGYTEAEKNLNRKLAAKEKEMEELRSRAGFSEQTLQSLQKEYGQLQDQFEKLDALARELSEKYARVNLDDASQLYQDAFRLFQSGDLDGAMRLWQNANLSKQVDDLLEEEKRIGQLQKELDARDAAKNRHKDDLMQNLRLKADAHRLRLEWDSVATTYAELVRLDTSRYENLKDYAEFLADQNQVSQAIYFSEKALAVAATKVQETNILLQLGLQYESARLLPDAERCIRRSLEINEFLSKNAPEDLKLELNYAGAKAALAQVLGKTQRRPEAETMLTDGIASMEALAAKDAELTEPILAVTLVNAGYYYIMTQQYEPAEKKLHRAVEILERLHTKDPVKHDALLSAVLVNLFNCYINTEQAEKAENALLRSLEICEKLSKENPYRYQEKLAGRLTNLGVYYLTVGNLDKVEVPCLRAVDILQKSALTNAAQAEPQLSSLVGNLGVYYATVGRLNDAEAMFKRSVETLERLSKQYPDQFDQDLADGLVNLGACYVLGLKISDAELAFRRSIDIFERLGKDDPGAFNESLADAVGQAAWCCVAAKNWDEGKKLANKAHSLAPSQSHANLALGHCYLAEDNWPKAKSFYEIYLKSVGDADEARNMLAKDWDDLISLGVQFPDINKARNWLRK